MCFGTVGHSEILRTQRLDFHCLTRLFSLTETVLNYFNLFENWKLLNMIAYVKAFTLVLKS